MAAKAGLRFHEPQLVNDVVAGVRGMRPEQQISLAQSHATAMREQVADRHLVRNIGIVHDKTRKPLINAVVP